LAFYAIVLLAGVFQASFGLMRLGSLLRFMPQPVMAGFQNAAAALLFLLQLGNVCGFDPNVTFMPIGSHLHEIKPLSLLVAAVTFASMWEARKWIPKFPALLSGLAVGTILYYALAAFGLASHLGPELGLSTATPALYLGAGVWPSGSDM